MATLASLAVNLTANSAQLLTEVQKANKSIQSFEQKTEQVGIALKKLAGAAAVGVFTGMVKESVDAADRIGKLSQRLGASTESLSQLKHVADLSGVSFNTLTMGLQRMTRRVSEAAAGTGEAKGALQELGISAEKLNAIEPAQQFEVLADALMQVENDADRVRLAMKLFDSEGVSLIQTMQGGAAGIQAMREEADRLGLTITDVAAKQAADFNDAITKSQSFVKGLAQEIGINAITAFNSMSDAFTNVGDASQRTAPELSGITTIIKGAGAVGFVTFNTLQALAQGVTALGFAAAEAAQGNFRSAISELKIGFEEMKNEIREAQEGVENLFPNLAGGVAAPLPGLEGPAPIPLPGFSDFSSSGEGDGDKNQEAEDKRLRQLFGGNPEDILSRIEEQFLSEQELIQKNYQDNLALLENFEKEKLISKEKFERLSLLFAKKANDERDKLRRAEFQRELQNSIITIQSKKEFWQSMLQANVQGSRALFNIQKAARIAEAVVNGTSAAIASFRYGAQIGGPPVGAAFAAASIAFTAARIQQLKSSTFGSSTTTSGGVSSLNVSSVEPASSTAAIPAFDDPAISSELQSSANDPIQKRVVVAIEGGEGELLPKSALRQLAEEINELEDANVRIVI